MLQWLNNHAFEPLIDYIFPRTCILCNDCIDKGKFCLTCEYEINHLVLSDIELEINALTLQKHAHLFKNKYTLYFFHKEMKIQTLIHKIKYDGYVELGYEMGEKLGSSIKQRNWEINAVVPVPMHPQKQKKRGYNQAEILAKGCADVLGLPLINNFLAKNRNTKTQTKLSSISRFKNTQDVFSATAAHSEYEHLLLIDDVFTTGSTLATCASKLKSINGVSTVSMATLAMTI